MSSRFFEQQKSFGCFAQSVTGNHEGGRDMLLFRADDI